MDKCVVTDLRPLKTAMVMLGESVNLTTVCLGRLRFPMWFTSTKCPYCHQYLTTNRWKGVTTLDKISWWISIKVCGRTRYRSRYLWLWQESNQLLKFNESEHLKWNFWLATHLNFYFYFSVFIYLLIFQFLFIFSYYCFF